MTAGGRWLHLAELTSPEVKQIAHDAVLVVGTGSLEQHGPHFPMGTDAMTVATVLQAARTSWGGSATVVEAPVVPYGASEHHLFAGALSIAPTIFIDLIGSLIRTAFGSGFRRVLIVNGHGGNSAALNVAIQDAAVRYAGVFAAVDYWSLIERRLVNDPAIIFPGHAGAFESAILAAGGRAPREADDGEPSDKEGLVMFDQRFFGTASVAVHGDWQAAGAVSDSGVEAGRLDGDELVQNAATRLALLLEDLASLSPA